MLEQTLSVITSFIVIIDVMEFGALSTMLQKRAQNTMLPICFENSYTSSKIW